MASVIIEERGQQLLRTELRGPSMSIGRDEANDLRLENRALSRRHAKLEIRGASIWIRDLGSQNGTFINGERLEGARAINGGDVISLGGKFELRLDGVEEALDTTPVLTLNGPEGTHRFAMVGDEIVLGRSPDCDISIGRKSISRRHLKVFIKDGRFFAEDLGSQNGTRVNGEKIRDVTEVGADDEIRVSEYVIRVSHLEQAAEEDAAASGAHKPNRTMLLDRSKLAAAADLGGDFQVQVTHENRLTFSVDGAAGGDAAGQGLEWADGDELAETAAPAKMNKPAAIRPAMGGGGRKSGSQNPAQVKAPTPAAPSPAAASLEVQYESGRNQTVKLTRDPVLISEDGSEPAPFDNAAYAPVGYILLVPGATGWVAAVVGDRRMLEVGGQHAPYQVLKDGDVLTLGGVTVTYKGG